MTHPQFARYYRSAELTVKPNAAGDRERLETSGVEPGIPMPAGFCRGSLGAQAGTTAGWRQAFICFVEISQGSWGRHTGLYTPIDQLRNIFIRMSLLRKYLLSYQFSKLTSHRFFNRLLVPWLNVNKDCAIVFLSVSTTDKTRSSFLELLTSAP